MVFETNPLPGDYQRPDDYREVIDWTTPGLEITRLRLLSDPGHPWWNVSYCHGVLDGQVVRVALPFSDLPRKHMRRALYDEAKASGCYIKGLFSAISTLC